ncbi:SNF2 family N-terminal domain-containing protein [Triangularia verruculosa]|uniref:SNF2 family N-terminal domain-containing protein n=1 Tax=Triangularia verruculosa TaxID=2587418 RepID=A0AAN7AXZ2_9PEZI|nr:SNF2 family N-terminal domain-containing protein [Triangularia verruculosa]
MNHPWSPPELHLHPDDSVCYDAVRPSTPGALQLPKRHREHESLCDSAKRTRSISNASEAYISTPCSIEMWMPSTDASPSPSALVHARSPIYAQHATVVDWVPPNNSPDNPIICYGAICEAKACFQQPKQASKLTTAGERFCHFRIVPFGSYFALADEHETPIAVLDMATCGALRQLQKATNVDLGGVVHAAQLTAKKRTSAKGLIVTVSINIYGSMSNADQVGLTLSSISYFLQHPFYLPLDYEYYNPQMFRSDERLENLTHLVGIMETEFKAKAISDEVQRVLELLGTHIYDDTIGDKDQPTFDQPEAIITTLKRHQVTALRFMRQRENHEHCQKVHQELRSNLRLPSHHHVPSYGMGGILADVMGLGKTLTTISAITSTLDDSRSLPVQEETQLAAILSSATLVVVSSTQVLDVWETEIMSHVRAGILRTYKFHGNKRATDPKELQHYDIVLTTYGVLSADNRGRSVLQQVQWYRVVLDEAHWIRNQSSKQFKAAISLKSTRRWCLTGTPIQNRLGDLVSLLSFLHFHPFCQPIVFQQHVLEPLRQDTSDRGYRLRCLLSAICLRRSDKLLNLPEPIFESISIPLHNDEKDVYKSILKQCERDIDMKVSSQAKIKRYAILFAAIMKLRRLCNHGTHPVVSNRLLGTEMTDDDDAEDGCGLCEGNGEDKLDLGEGEICPQCGRDTSVSSLTKPKPRSQSKSPVRPTVIDILLSPITSQSAGQQTSSKIEAVIGRLKQTEFGSKSLVFSYWTATLNLLERYMNAAGISHLRIDGRVDSSRRLCILETFRTTQVPVLLMTIQTGAVGLNLTAANYVHIVEPQWNPSVEEQAIARAIRMGQTRRVTVVRYVVKNSVEENIVNLQKRKRNLAKFTLDGTDDEGISGTLDDLNFVLNFAEK